MKLLVFVFCAAVLSAMAQAEVQTDKRSALESLKELGPTITDYTLMRKKNVPGKRAAFYIDDVIWVFRDLATQKPRSCWDHRFLGHLKEAHERYGLKVQLNCFYKADGSRLQGVQHGRDLSEHASP